MGYSFKCSFLKVIILGILFTAANAKAQNVDSIKQKRTQWVSQKLHVDEIKAGQVAVINDNYKQSVKNVISDGGLSEKQKRSKIDVLIAEKNRQLNAILTREQLNKIVPTSERKNAFSQKELDSLKKEKQIQFMSNLLSVDQKKAALIIDIQEQKLTNVKRIMNNPSISEQNKRIQITQFNAEQYTRLKAILSPGQIEVLAPAARKSRGGFDPSFVNVANHKETLAIQDSFEKQIKITMSNKRLSEQAKKEAVAQLVQQRNINLMKAIGGRADRARKANSTIKN
jgi:archaellum component FlaF (FlaF/FlaG flagellin family)